MAATRIDGKAFSETYRGKIKTEAEAFAVKTSRKPGLAVVLVGENAASQVYVRNKIAACEQTAIQSFAYFLPEQTSQDKLMELIAALNDDKNVDGILVQLPLPKQIDERFVLSQIDPRKDVDGFHAVSAGNLMLGNPCLAACTPSGILELIRSTGVPIAGRHAVVVGRSNIVGKPVALLLLQNDATITVTHSKTQNLAEITRTADILVVAIGRKEFVTGDMIKPGAIVIDVGMNRFEGKLYGDVHYDSAAEKAGFITPVPGGVGPMTITMLMQNTIKAASFGR